MANTNYQSECDLRYHQDFDVCTLCHERVYTTSQRYVTIFQTNATTIVTHEWCYYHFLKYNNHNQPQTRAQIQCIWFVQNARCQSEIKDYCPCPNTPIVTTYMYYLGWCDLCEHCYSEYHDNDCLIPLEHSTHFENHPLNFNF